MNERERPKGGGQPSEEELRAAMEEQLRRVRVQDVLLQTVATLVNLGGRRLGLAPESEGERDLEQARLAIEGTRALVPLLGPEEARAVRDALSQLQVAFAREAGSAPAGAEEQAPAGAGEATSPPPGGQRRPGGKEPTPEEVERAKARAKIWTPGKS